MTPFPHILTVPEPRNDFQLRVVSDIPVYPGCVLTCIYRKKSFQVGEVILQRPARGDWEAYPQHPTYYQCTGSEYEEPKQDQETPESYELKQKQVFPV